MLPGNKKILFRNYKFNTYIKVLYKKRKKGYGYQSKNQSNKKGNG